MNITTHLNKNVPWNEQYLFHQYLGQSVHFDAISVSHKYLWLPLFNIWIWQYLLQHWFKSRVFPCLLVVDWKMTNRTEYKGHQGLFNICLTTVELCCGFFDICFCTGDVLQKVETPWQNWSALISSPLSGILQYEICFLVTFLM